MTETRILDSIRDLLRAHGAAFREVKHAPTRTSEESARARGVPLALGGKAIVGKCDETYIAVARPVEVFAFTRPVDPAPA